MVLRRAELTEAGAKLGLYTPEGSAAVAMGWAPMPHLPQPEPRSTWERWNLQRAAIGEDNDCVPRAFAAGSGMPYEESIKLHASMGRKRRKGMKRDLWERTWRFAGYELGESLDVGKATIRQVVSMPELRTGVWIILTRQHVTCMRDGEVHDWAGNSRKRVIWVKPLRKL